MPAQRDLTYTYGKERRNKARCRVRIWQRGGRNVVLMTEMPDNPGISVTNAVEHIVSQLAKDFALAPMLTTWIEHYPKEPMTLHGKDRSIPESFDVVTFTWRPNFEAAGPQWKRITQAALEATIGETWSIERLDQPELEADA